MNVRETLEKMFSYGWEIDIWLPDEPGCTEGKNPWLVGLRIKTNSDKFYMICGETLDGCVEKARKRLLL